MLTGKPSLQARLVALVVAAMVTVWSAAAVTVWLDARHELDELLDGHLAQAAALLVVQQSRDMDEGHGLDAPPLHRYAPKVAFQVFHEGRLAMRSTNAPQQPMGRLPAASGFEDLRIDGADWRVFTARGAESDVVVHVGERRDSRAAILAAVLQSMLWPLLLALPLLAAATWWAIRSGIEPLRRLGRVLSARRADDLQPVGIDGAPAEMQPLLASLDGLFDRIAVLLDAERRFTADAAHELRTPLAAIRAQAQVALHEADPGQRRHALLAALQGCDRATRVVEQLLTLARLEAGESGGRSNVDMGAVTQGLLAELAPAALARGQSLELDAEPGCVVEGDEMLLGVLLRNLVDNALRYSPEGARVRVRVRRSGDQVVVAVEDSGPGIAQDQLARLGERFWRFRREDGGGSGLGWSIARRIAQAHLARMTAHRSQELGGLAVELCLPAPPEAQGRVR
ncbi:MAG: sensor histidine kinase N-terminal domain-containing protein [Burkholderiales bacterium]|nr:sensor histidine kinase N-terminal domain-containing protein [Burkholderiales bacterium]